jgi:septal ring factor EnvC (AmiA/AmiB activator)
VSSGTFPRLISVLALFLSLLTVVAVCANASQRVEDLKKSIQDQQSKVAAKKKEMLRLTQKERELYGDLAGLEDRIRDLQVRVDESEEALHALESQEKEQQVQVEQLSRELEGAKKQLRELLTWLWPAYFQSFEVRARAMDSWADADREFSWLSFFYHHTRRSMRRVARMAEESVLALSRLAKLRSQAEAQLLEVNALKDRVLQNRLKLVREVQRIRAVKLDQEEEITALMSSIEDLDYQVRTLTAKKIQGLKGYLPWPAKGRVIKRFNPGASPPVKGIGLSVGADAQVRAVCWGQVVHAGQLRGFGNVVVLFHGDHYYSLYAFLSQVDVQVGLQVEKGEPIARCGFYPPAEGPGLYFELRFGQKVVNPLQWFAEN